MDPQRTCPRTDEVLLSFLDGSPDVDVDRLRAHLEDCDRCASALEESRELDALLAASTDTSIDDDEADALLAGVYGEANAASVRASAEVDSEHVAAGAAREAKILRIDAGGSLSAEALVDASVESLSRRHSRSRQSVLRVAVAAVLTIGVGIAAWALSAATRGTAGSSDRGAIDRGTADRVSVEKGSVDRGSVDRGAVEGNTAARGAAGNDAAERPGGAEARRDSRERVANTSPEGSNAEPTTAKRTVAAVEGFALHLPFGMRRPDRAAKRRVAKNSVKHDATAGRARKGVEAQRSTRLAAAHRVETEDPAEARRAILRAFSQRWTPGYDSLRLRRIARRLLIETRTPLANTRSLVFAGLPPSEGSLGPRARIDDLELRLAAARWIVTSCERGILLRERAAFVVDTMLEARGDLRRGLVEILRASRPTLERELLRRGDHGSRGALAVLAAMGQRIELRRLRRCSRDRWSTLRVVAAQARAHGGRKGIATLVDVFRAASAASPWHEAVATTWTLGLNDRDHEHLHELLLRRRRVPRRDARDRLARLFDLHFVPAEEIYHALLDPEPSD